MIITLLALFIVFLGLISLFIHHRKNEYMSGWESVAILLLTIGGLILLICMIQISTKEMRASAEIAKIEAIRETFESARMNENIHPLELAAMQQKAIDKNEWIANARYWTEQPLTNWFWSKKILEIKPIK